MPRCVPLPDLTFVLRFFPRRFFSDGVDHEMVLGGKDSLPFRVGRHPGDVLEILDLKCRLETASPKLKSRGGKVRGATASQVAVPQQERRRILRELLNPNQILPVTRPLSGAE
jgi:hypothetical protein